MQDEEHDVSTNQNAEDDIAVGGGTNDDVSREDKDGGNTNSSNSSRNNNDKENNGGSSSGSALDGLSALSALSAAASEQPEMTTTAKAEADAGVGTGTSSGGTDSDVDDQVNPSNAAVENGSDTKDEEDGDGGDDDNDVIMEQDDDDDDDDDDEGTFMNANGTSAGPSGGSRGKMLRAQESSDMLEENDDDDDVAMEDAEMKEEEEEGPSADTTSNDQNTDSVLKEEKSKNNDDGDDKMETDHRDTPGNGTLVKSEDGDDGRKGSASTINKKTKDGEQPSTTEPPSGSSGATSMTPVVSIPVMKGVMFADEDGRHTIRGMWKFSTAPDEDKLDFSLSRKLGPDEDPKELPKDGEFSGSFRNKTKYTAKNGVLKSHETVINESGVNIKFVRVVAEETDSDAGQTYNVNGTGTNPFGTFSLKGTASLRPDGQYEMVLQKEYITQAIPVAPANKKKSKNKKSKKGSSASLDADADAGTLPPPSQMYETSVVCQRGTVSQEAHDEMGGLGESVVITKIEGTWAQGLDLILADPDNENKLQGPFVLKYNGRDMTFPVSGKYTGFFMFGEQKITEKDVTLKFRKNSAGYYNIEGKGQNRTGKYTISGRLTNDKVITMFRLFPVAAPKNKKAKVTTSVPVQVTSAPPPINPPGQSRRPSIAAVPASTLSLNDVEAPDVGTKIDPFQPPENGTYVAVTRGVLRVDDDGSYSCNGKWASTREVISTPSQSSMCNLRLEAHFVQEALKKVDATDSSTPTSTFPLDSDQYKGSFEVKRPGARPLKIIDNQVVMKFRQVAPGQYNVYGKGANSIGGFTLSGTMIKQGNTSGMIELYRNYPPDLLHLRQAEAKKPKTNKKSSSVAKSSASSVASNELSALNASASAFPARPAQGIGRRESTRTSKMPSRLEDDSPEARLARSMEKCSQLLKTIEQKDATLGSFFAKPVDPVAMKIPNYYSVIDEPMDLETLRRKMDAGEVETPEEFQRLVQLIFSNAIKFNEVPTNAVHQSARQLLTFFNARYTSMVGQTNRSGDTSGKKGGKNADKKRKRDAQPEVMTPKRRRMKEAEDMLAENEKCVAALVSAAPVSMSSDPSAVPVSRQEFNLMLNMIQKLQQQVVKTHKTLAEISSDAPEKPSGQARGGAGAGQASVDAAIPSGSQAKKKTKKKTESAPKAKPAPAPAPAASLISDEPLPAEEQEWLTIHIAEMIEEEKFVEDVVEIIKSSDNYHAEDEDEIDLEIDQLDNRTQRKLLQYVRENMNPSKKQPAKVPRKQKAAQGRKKSPKKATEPSPVAAAAPSYSPKAGTGGGKFFSFGEEDGSDSDSDGEINEDSAAATAPSKGARPGTVGGKDFRLGGLDDDSDDDDEEDNEAGGALPNWDVSKMEEDAVNPGGDEDDEWNNARTEAMEAKAREEQKKIRDEKLQAEAEHQKNQRLAEAVAHGEEIKMKREAEKEEKARQMEEKQREEEEERMKARELARKENQSVERTVDLDADRNLMRQLEEENYMGGASPSSDFGF